MNILLSGATGLIGQAVGQELVRRGHSVIALSRSVVKAKETLTFPCEIREWKNYDVAPQLEANDKVDVVIHLSGESVAEKRWSTEQKEKIRNSRVIGTRNLIQALESRSEKLKAWVQGSAIGLYGDTSDQVVGEDQAPGSDFLAKVVKDWEAEADSYAQKAKHRIVKIRTGIVLASNGGALTKLFDVFHRGVGGRLGDGQQYMSWIHLNDIVNLFVFAAENVKVSGAVNGTAPEPVTNKELTSKLASALGRSEFLPVPKIALKLAMGEMSEVLLASTRAKSRAQDLGFKFQFEKLEDALADLCRGMDDGSRVIESEQYVDESLEKVFEFFSSANNLEALTPPFLNFKVLESSTKDIGQGTLIDYQLSLHGIPLKWKTLIDQWDPPHKFVDTQLRGPYTKWHHTHTFEKLGKGTLIKDRVEFKVPLGLAGDLTTSWKVVGDVNTIFAYRHKKILELFN